MSALSPAARAPAKLWTARPSWYRAVIDALILCVAIVVLGYFSVELSPEGSSVAAWWPAAGVAVAAVTTRWSSRWPMLTAVLTATVIANLAAGRSGSVAAGFGVSNTIEVAIVAWWLHRVRRDEHGLRGIGDLVLFGVGAVFGALTIGVGATLTISRFGTGDPLSVFANIVPSHLTAILLITPLAMGTRAPISRSAIEHVSSWALTTAITLLVFWPGQTLPLAFLPSVIMIWSAIRLGLRSTAAQLTFVAVTVTVAMHVGGGFPTWASGAIPVERAGVVVQIYIFTTAIVLYLLAGALGEREAALIQVRASEELYRAGFAEANVGMLLIRLDSQVPRVVEVNATAANLLTTRFDAPSPGGIATSNGATIATIAESLTPGQGWTGDMRSTTDVPARWFSVSITRLSQLKATPSLASVQIVESTEHHHLRTQLERLALTDSLTNLPNRAALVAELNRALARARATSSHVAITFFDLDEFKLVNDVYGHLAGDELLREMAERFRSVVGDHLLARIGGDEFVLMCPAVDSIDDALAVSQRVVATMDRPVTLHGINHIVTISGGLTLSSDGSTSAQMLREADVALYAAKAAGKRRLTVYSPELGALASDRVRIETELRSAISNSEFDMHMQPVIDVHTGAIEAAEALIRWHHPTDGLRPPGVWLDIAERSGMMPELGAWALDRSITEAVKWINAVGIERAPVVHVNVSARQLDQPGFDTMVLATLDRHRFPPTKLILELTETFLAHVSAELVDELRHLHESGVRIAADDFGTGYSPLTRIIELPISMIKIDRQFLWNAVDDPRSQAIVKSLLQLASTLDFDVVAEGVETSEQRDLLRDLDCRLAQGYLWSRPVTPEAFLATLIEHHGTRVSRLGIGVNQRGEVIERAAATLAARTA